MIDPVVETLMREYDQVSAYLRDNALIAYRVLPVVFTIGAGLTIYFTPQNAIVGPALLFGSFLVVVWLGLCHSMVNSLGVRLTEIEQRINRRLPESQDVGLSHYTIYIAEGMRVHPGLKLYYGLLLIALVLVLCFAHVQFWRGMTEWGWNLGMKLVFTALPICLNSVAVLNLLYIEKETLRLKTEVIRRCRDNME